MKFSATRIYTVIQFCPERTERGEKRSATCVKTAAEQDVGYSYKDDSLECQWDKELS